MLFLLSLTLLTIITAVTATAYNLLLMRSHHQYTFFRVYHSEVHQAFYYHPVHPKGAGPSEVPTFTSIGGHSWRYAHRDQHPIYIAVEEIEGALANGSSIPPDGDVAVYRETWLPIDFTFLSGFAGLIRTSPRRPRQSCYFTRIYFHW